MHNLYLTSSDTILCVGHFHCTNGGPGKREAHIDWLMVIPAEKAAPVIGTTLRATGLAPAASRQ